MQTGQAKQIAFHLFVNSKNLGQRGSDSNKLVGP